MDRIGIIITAGGSGKRMGSQLPKQFIEVDGTPILIRTLQKLSDIPNSELVLVLPKEWISYWQELCQRHNCTIVHKVIEGGNERFHSVRNGIEALEEVDYIAIHDGVRPFVDTDIFERVFQAAKSTGAALPAIKPVDSMREISESGDNKIADRNRYVLVQTPQIFSSKMIRRAYEQPFSTQFTDDASVVEACGHKITLVEGTRQNIKITTEDDLQLAEFIITRQQN